jgi:hypothetical protein
VKLADHRGKTVVLDFWGNWDETWRTGLPRMLQMKERFRNHPIEFLPVHDASITSLAAYQEVVAKIEKELGVAKLPVQMLLDRPPIGAGTGPYPARAGEHVSGRTFDRYEVVSVPSTFVIDSSGRVVFGLMRCGAPPFAATSYRLAKDGKLATHVEDEPATAPDGERFLSRSGMDALEEALQKALGLPISPRAPEANRRGQRPARPRFGDPYSDEEGIPRGPITVRGLVVNPSGRPISGATVSQATDFDEGPKVATSPHGEFALPIEFKEPDSILELKVEAPGMAARAYTASPFAEARETAITGWFVRMDAKGVLAQPLILGPGATVTGRVLRDGKPVASISLGLHYRGDDIDLAPGTPEAKTDPRGVFRFEHVRADAAFAAYAEWSETQQPRTFSPRLFNTGNDGTTVDLGDVELVKPKTLAGRIVFSDGKTPFRKARLFASPANGGSASVGLDQAGRFRVEGLPPGPVSVRVLFENGQRWISYPTGYRLSSRNKCLNPRLPTTLTGRLDHDILDLTILFEPGEAPTTHIVNLRAIDPTTLADFQDAESGPLTGASPSAWPDATAITPPPERPKQQP